MDIVEAHRRTVEAWQAKLDAVTADQWSNPTPCTEWSVRDLVNHVVGEELWMVPLLQGQTIADVGDRLDGDVLGEDPVATGRSASGAALAVSDEILPAGGKVLLSYGEEDASEYAWQLTADHLIHGWDLAKGAGLDTEMDPELVTAVADWFATMEDAYRSSGAIGPRTELTGNPQTDLLAAFGRSADWSAPS
ncbi:MAG TPA: TIGR03086 family metal-binding protein [Nocardioidaceae bacterium]|nr:TIGR03086 family metal-binding protein [Nocardioidaceae bacterium]